jgi:hypothetical protein
MLGETKRMSKIDRSMLVGICSVVAITLLTDVAYSCTRCGAANPGRGCGQLVFLKHPDLKGPARKKEVGKCVSDPDSYGK